MILSLGCLYKIKRWNPLHSCWLERAFVLPTLEDDLDHVSTALKTNIFFYVAVTYNNMTGTKKHVFLSPEGRYVYIYDTIVDKYFEFETRYTPL